jgi:hydrophobic/amphiphilic exporter-1 (mainly G- bacteria), HAE1 family
MIPLITSRGIGAGFNRATAGVVVGGQTMSLALTLLATPVAYSFFDDVTVWVRKRFSSGRTVDRGERDLDGLGAGQGRTGTAAAPAQAGLPAREATAAGE